MKLPILIIGNPLGLKLTIMKWNACGHRYQLLSFKAALFHILSFYRVSLLCKKLLFTIKFPWNFCQLCKRENILNPAVSQHPIHKFLKIMNNIPFIWYISTVKQNCIHSQSVGSPQITPSVIYIQTFCCINCQFLNSKPENAFIWFSSFQISADTNRIKILIYIKLLT